MHVNTLRSDLWQARGALLAVIVLQLLVQSELKLGGQRVWVVAALESVLLLSLTVSSERRARRLGPDVSRPGQASSPTAATPGFLAEHGGLPRALALLLIGLVSVINLVGLVRLIATLLAAGKAQGVVLLADALNLFATNVIIFGLWYWEIDRGGPWRRLVGHANRADFLFPQMALDAAKSAEAFTPHWRPRFIDYLYLAFTNATAFSPTDTLPLSAQAKLLMMLQAGVSLMTVAIVAARAVNILA